MNDFGKVAVMMVIHTEFYPPMLHLVLREWGVTMNYAIDFGVYFMESSLCVYEDCVKS